MVNKMRKISEKITNFLFCKKYPFWTFRQFKGYKHNKEIYRNSYSITWYDAISSGWKKAFGKELSDEILRVGNKYLKEHKDKKWNDIIHWQQIKSKYGELRLYASAVEPIMNILDKYEWLSIGYCEFCGKPARYMTEGWIIYLCEDCYLEYHKELDCDSPELAKHMKEDRLTKKDIPVLTRYEKGKDIKVNIKKEFGVDYYKLWNLKK